MQWMATDFEQERANHLRARRKMSKGVMTYFRTQGSREEKQLREQQERLKRVAHRVAREVKGFWKKINKVVAFKQKLEVDEQRKRAMDKHLSFLVQQVCRLVYTHTHTAIHTHM
jgi:E1A-binding protein p400